jgi:hypothetical protein
MLALIWTCRDVSFAANAQRNDEDMNMADILKFTPPDDPGPRVEQTAPAQIIIFPGVRIERREFAIGDRMSTRPGQIETRKNRLK